MEAQLLRGSGKAGGGDQREMRSPASAAAGREDHCHFLEAELKEIGKTGKCLITRTSFKRSPQLVQFSDLITGLKLQGFGIGGSFHLTERVAVWLMGFLG